MKKILFMIPVMVLGACNGEKTYVLGQDAFCTGTKENSEETIFCIDTENNPINGILVEKYQNGNIFRKIHMKNGHEDGLKQEYYESGKLKLTTNMVDGRVSGTNKLYGEDGKLYMEIVWDNGNATSVKVYDKDGKVVATQ